MISLLILLILAWQFYIGYNRGLLLQAFYLLGSLLALIIASQQFQKLADLLSLWLPYANPNPDSQMLFFRQVDLFALDTVFYRGAAFLTLYLISYAVVRFFGVMVQGIRLEKWQQQSHHILAGLLSLLTSLISLSLFFNLVATIPFTLIQTKLAASLALSLLIKLPLLSQVVTALWLP